MSDKENKTISESTKCINIQNTTHNDNASTNKKNSSPTSKNVGQRGVFKSLTNQHGMIFKIAQLSNLNHFNCNYL